MMRRSDRPPGHNDAEMERKWAVCFYEEQMENVVTMTGKQKALQKISDFLKFEIFLLFSFPRHCDHVFRLLFIKIHCPFPLPSCFLFRFRLIVTGPIEYN